MLTAVTRCVFFFFLLTSFFLLLVKKSINKSGSVRIRGQFTLRRLLRKTLSSYREGLEFSLSFIAFALLPLSRGS